MEKSTEPVIYESLEEYEFFYPVVQFFKYAHLPEHLQEKSKPFGELALKVCRSVDGYKSEIEKSLDALMVSKDAAVRAAFQK